MDPVRTFNALEAVLWITFAVIIAGFGSRVRGLTPTMRALLAVSFLAFGSSDLIETSTGAWWRPPGLLVYKGVCLLGIGVCCLDRIQPAIFQGKTEQSDPIGPRHSHTPGDLSVMSV
jgi:hypothetical protein